MEDNELIEKYQKLIMEYKKIEEDFQDLDFKIRKGNISSEQRAEFFEDLRYDREELERLSILIDRLKNEIGTVGHSNR